MVMEKENVKTGLASGEKYLLTIREASSYFNIGTKKLRRIEDRVPSKVDRVIDGYSGFLFYDEKDMPLVAMHWQHRFNHMVNRYNDIFKVQLPNITPHVCRHTYCSNQAKAG
ncbi:Phage integrase family protein [Lachnospiraceae bacterium]|nr:Phage integrase family protein [Lachnospiraceae bacterium]